MMEKLEYHQRIAGGIDRNGVKYTVDTTALKTRALEENPVINSIIEQGVRQFLGLDEAPTFEMIDFLKNMGILTSIEDTEEQGNLLHS